MRTRRTRKKLGSSLTLPQFQVYFANGQSMFAPLRHIAAEFNTNYDMNPPEHPGQPKWQSFKEWNTMRQPSSFQVIKTAQESREELLAKFGLQDDNGGGWGDASDAQDAGWGTSTDTADGQGGGWN